MAAHRVDGIVGVANRPAIARFGVGLVGLAAVSAIVWLTVWAAIVPPMFGWSPVAIMSGSMEPLIDTGDVVVVAPYDGEELRTGTVVVFDDGDTRGPVTHRIIDVTPDGDYVTHGDANGRIDSTPVSPDDIVGVGRMLVPGIGRPLAWADTGQWFALIVAMAMTAMALWAARWALLSRFSPWGGGVKVPPTPGTRGRIASRLAPVAVVVVVALGAAVVTTTRTTATFAAPTDNAGNSLIADILQPPTALNATGGAVISLGWTITPDTYAAGHRVFRATTSGGPYAQIAQTTPRTTATFEDSPPDGTYYYVVRAYLGNWESVNSNEASATLITPEDFDAVSLASDNCPTTFNVDQYDTDGDTTGDACDTSPTVASSGLFHDSGLRMGAVTSTGVSLADFDGDGDLDATYANDGSANTVWFNNGTGTLVNGGQSLGTAQTYGVAVGDFDGDGDVDITYSNRAANTIWFNNGAGVFTDSGQALGSSDSNDVAVGDFDGDGDLDIAYADKFASSVWLNNGSGVFSDSGQALEAEESRGIAVHDVDGDADLDIVYANRNNNSVWLNNGAGVFSDSGPSLAAGDSAALGDLDGDGDNDIVFGTRGGSSAIWFNNGSGVFTNSGQTLTGDVRGVVLGDLDGDGDLDIAFAVRGTNVVYVNNGSGTFTNSGQSLDLENSLDIAAGDLDADGDLDLIAANEASKPNTVWVNDIGAPVAPADSWQTGLTHVSGAGADRVLVLVASNEQQTTSSPTLTGVTYGGQAMTLVRADGVSSGCCTARAEIWILKAAGIAAASSTTIVPTWTSAPDGPLYSHAVFGNVHQTTSIGATTSATVVGETPNPVPMSSVVTANGDVVIGAATAGEHGTYTAQNGFTLGVTHATNVGSSTTLGTSYKAATGASETVSMPFTPTSPPYVNRQVALAAVLKIAP